MYEGAYPDWKQQGSHYIIVKTDWLLWLLWMAVICVSFSSAFTLILINN